MAHRAQPQLDPQHPLALQPPGHAAGSARSCARAAARPTRRRRRAAPSAPRPRARRSAAAPRRAGPRAWRSGSGRARSRRPPTRAIRATRTSSIPWLEISSQATSRIRSRPPPGRPRGRGVDVVGTRADPTAGQLWPVPCRALDRQGDSPDGGPRCSASSRPQAHLRQRRLDARPRARRRRRHRVRRDEDRHRAASATTRSRPPSSPTTPSRRRRSRTTRCPAPTSATTRSPTADVRNGSLQAADFAASQLPAGPKGDPGAPATSIFGVVTADGGLTHRQGRDRHVRRGARLHGHDQPGRERTARSSRRCAAATTATSSPSPTGGATPTQITFTTRDGDRGRAARVPVRRVLLGARGRPRRDIVTSL